MTARPVELGPVHIAAVAVVEDLVPARHAALDVWRTVRRYDPPVQAALYAAHRALADVPDPSKVGLIALAPCNAGSPEMFGWVRRIEASQRAGLDAAIRMNPVHTLHAVDNLALSALSLGIGATGYGVCLGGAAGMAWVGLEMAAERLASGPETQVLLFGGDQDSGEHGGGLCGVALLLEAGAAPPSVTALWLPLVDRPAPPHATRGLVGMWRALNHRREADWYYDPPGARSPRHIQGRR